MTKDKIKQVLDACYQAKRVRDLMPKLPNGVTPSHIHYLDTIRELEGKQDRVKVSDISDALGLPRPSVTKTVKDMESLGFVEKETSENDARYVYLRTTKTGRELIDTYVDEYFDDLGADLADITDDEADAMIKLVERLHEVMGERSQRHR